MGTENLAPTGIRSPNRPVRSESEYRLSYPGPFHRRGAGFSECLCFTVSITKFSRPVCNWSYVILAIDGVMKQDDLKKIKKGIHFVGIYMFEDGDGKKV